MSCGVQIGPIGQPVTGRSAKIQLLQLYIGWPIVATGTRPFVRSKSVETHTHTPGSGFKRN